MNNSDKDTMTVGTKFKLVDDDTVYVLVGYNTLGEHVIYRPANVNENFQSGHLDITEVTDISEILY